MKTRILEKTHLDHGWKEMSEAPTDGTEIVGWMPTKGHVLMRFSQGWELYCSIPMLQKVGHSTMGWSQTTTSPIAWREKCYNSTEWIF